MNFRKVNNITGWVILVIASLVYFLTREATASFWDTGEFISSAYKVMNPHPPGAPFFTLLGRTFVIFFGNSPDTAARAVNLMSALASGFTILFLFWTITHFARKMYVSVGEELNTQQLFTVMGAGVIGALAYTFSDSFWYSAVEGEVYALSSFFTALVFWAMLKWEHADERAGNNMVDRNRADRWIVFIFFMMGLSIGVHLLNLLTIPAIVMIYYFRRYAYTNKGAIYAFIIGCILTGVVQVAVIQWSVKWAGKFDIFFVNNFNLPFFSGFIIFFILLAGLIFWGLKIARSKGLYFLRLGLWSVIFLMIGYSTYVTSLIRANADPGIDMNNVDNPMSLVYWLSREQYGSAPLVYGPHFMADYKINPATNYIEFDEGDMRYVKGQDKYIPIGRQQEPKFQSEDMQLFPRVWDRSNDQFHVDFYADWLNLGEYQDAQGQRKYEDPSFGDNLNWFITYQNGHMYWRYFMWNFAGRQNDIQGFGNKRDGNWISGFSFIDDRRLGDQSRLPDSIRDNNANNKLFLLPFILGILGCIYQFFRNRKDWIVSFLLFFFTGLAVVIYLNQPGNQPRERDYAYVGSFYAFAIWIGLAVIAISQLARSLQDKLTFKNTLLYGSIATFVIGLLSNTTSTFGDAMISSLMMTALFGIISAIAVFVARGLSSSGKNAMATSLVAFIICLISPILMAQQNWNDHDRSQKTLARDIAIDYLESCAPNAIVFTFGDNDTYPLWYAQEVEGVRKDIRLINNSLLGIDWYINQLRYKLNESPPIDVIWTPEQIQGHNREYLRYQPAGSKERFYDLYDVMKNVLGQGENVTSFPVKRFKVPVDAELVRKNGTLSTTDSILPELLFEIPENKNDLTKNDLMVLNIIASNAWKRPIYFTSPYGDLGFGQYLRKDGIAYRLVPAQMSYPQQNWVVENTLRQVGMGGTSVRDNNTDYMYENMMTKFKFGGADKQGVYYDEENRRHLLTIRTAFGEAAGNMADKNRKDEARKLLEKAEQNIRTDNLPYAMVSRYNSHNQSGLVYLEAAYKAGMAELAEKIRKVVRTDLEQQKAYYDYLKTEREPLYNSMVTEAEINNRMLVVLEAVEKQYAPQLQQKTGVEGPNPIINTPAQAADSVN
jgi:hypothetical protein